MSREAMKLALEALEHHTAIKHPQQSEHVDKAITALHAALDAPEPDYEPVAWRHERFFENASGWFYSDWHPEGLNPPNAQLLYTRPQPAAQWVGLTDEEIKEIIGPWGDTPIKWHAHKLFDQIETKLKEKNCV